jgi:hypothetical protein
MQSSSDAADAVPLVPPREFQNTNARFRNALRMAFSPIDRSGHRFVETYLDPQRRHARKSRISSFSRWMLSEAAVKPSSSA